MISIDQKRCIGCGQCVRDCFPEDILLRDGKAVPKNEKCFECGHCVAVCPVNAVSLNGYDMSEVQELEETGAKVDPQAFLDLMKSRRSIRQFRDTPVTDSQLERILEAGRYAPTGGNRQNVAYTVIRQDLPRVREQLIRQLGAAGRKMLEEGRRASFYTDMWLDMERDYRENGKDRLFFNAGTVILVSSDLSGFCSRESCSSNSNAMFHIPPLFRKKIYSTGTIANALAGYPTPSFIFGKAVTIREPVAGTWSRFLITSIWKRSTLRIYCSPGYG